MHPFQVTSAVLEDYQAYLHRYCKHDGTHLSRSSQRDRLVAVRSLFRWLHEHNRLRHNPAARIILPRGGRRLPCTVFSATEVEQVLAQPDVDTPSGLRDRALLELMHSTGIRRAEAGALVLGDLDTERSLLRIRQGKGRKDRIVPIGRRAVRWVQRYITESRPAFLGEQPTSVLFLRPDSRPLPLQRMTQLVSTYIRHAGLACGKQGSCHSLRHTMATLMLDRGADIRHIQAMLGHARLSTTQIYTHVSIRQLQQVHSRTHPAEVGAPEPMAAIEPEYCI
ncbi:tyrosine-type recombinase/integrase [Planctomycetales bacterium ZRK34]|nr:tyrosine-type recombinase/integrase [Planctomycetales bacterium ZRK34]